MASKDKHNSEDKTTGKQVDPEEVIKRMLNTPPKPKKKAAKKVKPAK